MAWYDPIETWLDNRTDEELGVFPAPEPPPEPDLASLDKPAVLAMFVAGAGNWEIRKEVSLTGGIEITNAHVQKIRELLEAEQTERYDALIVVP